MDEFEKRALEAAQDNAGIPTPCEFGASAIPILIETAKYNYIEGAQWARREIMQAEGQSLDDVLTDLHYGTWRPARLSTEDIESGEFFVSKAKYDKLKAELESAKQHDLTTAVMAESLRDNLLKYGSHDSDCAANLAPDEDYDIACTCGFSSALKGDAHD